MLRWWVLASFGVVAACHDGIAVSSGNAIAVGATWEVTVTGNCDQDICPIERVVSVESQDASISVESVAATSFVLRALRAGSADVRIVAVDDDGEQREDIFPYRAVDVTAVETSARQLCRGETPAVTRLHAGSEVTYGWSFGGAAPDIVGYLPFELSELSLVSAEAMTRTLVVTTAAVPDVMTAITLPQVPAFMESAVTYDATSVEQLEVHKVFADEQLTVAGFLRLEVDPMIGGEKLCRDEALFLTLHIDTPAICALTGDKSDDTALADSTVTLLGKAPGTCVLHIGVMGGSLDQVFQADVTAI